MENFSRSFPRETPKGDMNFIGAAIAFFDENTKNCAGDTKDTYIKDYNERIFRLVNPALPISEYTEEILENLCDQIRDTYGYTEETMAGRYNHLVVDPCDAFFKKMGNSPLWGSALKFHETQGGISVEEKLMKIPKSLSPKREKIVMKEIMGDPQTQQGVKVGLTIMFLSGARNEEACGVNFGDVVELHAHPGSYCLRIFETTSATGNTLKAGGKTHNAPRYIPIPSVLFRFLSERKNFVASQVTFPCKDKNGREYHSVDEMPAACRRNEYTERCDTDDLTDAGRKLLRETVKLKEGDVSGVNYIIRAQTHTAEDLGEREPTTYLFRRNMATHLYNLGFSLEQILYCMGHALTNTELSRADYTDEDFLYEMCVLQEKHPLNKPDLVTEIHAEKAKSLSYKDLSAATIDFPQGSADRCYLVRMKTREPGDPLSVTLEGGTGEVSLTTDSESEPPRREGHVVKQACELYK